MDHAPCNPFQEVCSVDTCAEAPPKEGPALRATEQRENVATGTNPNPEAPHGDTADPGPSVRLGPGAQADLPGGKGLGAEQTEGDPH